LPEAGNLAHVTGQTEPVSSEPELPADTAGPVTATVTRRVKPGHEAAYEEFLAGISGAAKAFPGYLGEEVFRPAGGAGGEYRIVYRFDSPALAEWMSQPLLAAMLTGTPPPRTGARHASIVPYGGYTAVTLTTRKIGQIIARRAAAMLYFGRRASDSGRTQRIVMG
jgi:Antibiotic biosynthesis monooxygenase